MNTQSVLLDKKNIVELAFAVVKNALKRTMTYKPSS